MDHNYYKISDIYRKNVVLKEFTGNPASLDSKNSYQTTASMMGPGHGPSNASDSQMAVNGNQVMFPSEQELSNYQKSELLIKFFKRELDEGTWDEKTNSLFQKLISYFLQLDSGDEEEDMDEPELK
jgi:hypothetical protein